MAGESEVSTTTMSVALEDAMRRYRTTGVPVREIEDAGRNMLLNLSQSLDLMDGRDDQVINRSSALAAIDAYAAAAVAQGASLESDIILTQIPSIRAEIARLPETFTQDQFNRASTDALARELRRIDLDRGNGDYSITLDEIQNASRPGTTLIRAVVEDIGRH